MNLKEREKGISLVGNNKVKAYNKKCCIAMNVACYFALIQCERQWAMGKAMGKQEGVFCLCVCFFMCTIFV